MTENKHTPGPWRVTEPNGKGNGIKIEGPGDWPRLPEAWIGFLTRSEEQCANAYLIAAAPDLLEALEMVRDADDDCKMDGLPTIPGPARAKIDAAIAKAKGQA